MIKSSLTFIALTIVQSVQPPEPVTPKMGPPPPVGDVPIDGSIIYLIVIALVLGTAVALRNRKRQQA